MRLFKLSLLLVQLLITTAAFVFGAAVVFGLTSGFSGVVFSPILALFGWYLWFPVLGFVLVAWWQFKPKNQSIVYRSVFILISSCIGFAASYVMSGKNPTSPPDFVAALRLAFVLSAGMASFLVVMCKTQMEREAS